MKPTNDYQAVKEMYIKAYQDKIEFTTDFFIKETLNEIIENGITKEAYDVLKQWTKELVAYQNALEDLNNFQI